MIQLRVDEKTQAKPQRQNTQLAQLRGFYTQTWDGAADDAIGSRSRLRSIAEGFTPGGACSVADALVAVARAGGLMDRSDAGFSARKEGAR